MFLLGVMYLRRMSMYANMVMEQLYYFRYREDNETDERLKEYTRRDKQIKRLRVAKDKKINTFRSHYAVYTIRNA